ncbi:hypothetical protein Ancab_037914 [Ancistrocladus abbreviatus]
MWSDVLVTWNSVIGRHFSNLPQQENRRLRERWGGKEIAGSSVQKVSPQQIWDTLSQLGIVEDQYKDRDIQRIAEMEDRDATAILQRNQKGEHNGGQVGTGLL